MDKLRGLNDYQEKLLTNLKLKGCELCLDDINPLFKVLLPTFSTTDELCVCIRHGGNAMYNMLAHHLERSNSDNTCYLLAVNIMEQFRWLWYDVKRKEVVCSTWVLSPTKEIAEKLGGFYKPDDRDCVLLLESFCQCSYFKSNDDEEPDCQCVPKISCSLNPFHNNVMNFYQENRN